MTEAEQANAAEPLARGLHSGSPPHDVIRWQIQLLAWAAWCDEQADETLRYGPGLRLMVPTRGRQLTIRPFADYSGLWNWFLRRSPDFDLDTSLSNLPFGCSLQGGGSGRERVYPTFLEAMRDGAFALMRWDRAQKPPEVEARG